MKVKLQELYTARGAAFVTFIMLMFSSLLPFNSRQEPTTSNYLSTSGSRIFDSSGSEFGFGGVYSPHDYPESVQPQSWFSDPDYPENLSSLWDRTRGYLASENIAPILIGELRTSYELLRSIQFTLSDILPARMSASLSSRTIEESDATQAKPKAEENPRLAASQGPSVIQVIDHFKSGTLHGWEVYQDKGSSIKMNASSGMDSKYSLMTAYSIGPAGWGGAEHVYGSPQKWDGYKQLRFNFYGNNTGNPIRVEILDNCAPGSTIDTAERFEVVFIDDFQGWRTITLPWSVFTRRSDWQPVDAPNNGLNLTNVWGLNFAPVEGEGWFKVERIQLEK